MTDSLPLPEETSFVPSSKISMLPLDAIDYIIAHEFCHIIYMNHSKDFYKLVQNIIPNYKEIVLWLKENNYKFVL